MQMLVRSQLEAQRIKLPVPHAIISICGSDSPDAKLKITPNTVGVLRLHFDDDLKEGKNIVLFSDDMARQVLNFYNEIRDKAEVLLVHCQAGISRSAAVASFLMQLDGQDPTPFMVPPKYPNVFVRNALRRVHHETTGQFIP